MSKHTSNTMYGRGFRDFHVAIGEPPAFLYPADLSDWRSGWEDAFHGTLNRALSLGATHSELHTLHDFRKRMLLRWQITKGAHCP